MRRYGSGGHPAYLPTPLVKVPHVGYFQVGSSVELTDGTQVSVTASASGMFRPAITT